MGSNREGKPPTETEAPKRTAHRTPRRTPRTSPRRRPRILPRPLGPHPVERGSVRIPVRDHVGGFTTVKLTPADYPLGMRHKWRLDQDGYVVGNVWSAQRQKSTRLALHRCVARAPAGVIVDHVFGSKLDCRRSALRHATPSENTANRRSPRTGRSSRYRGVTLHKQTGKWQAAAKYLNRNFYLGLFASEADAATAYNSKAWALWGRFAVLNRIPRPAGQAT